MIFENRTNVCISAQSMVEFNCTELERKHMAKQPQSCAFRTSIGGQALIEGILMRGPEKQAIVVRDQEGNLVEKVEELRLIKDRHPILGWPLIRGTVNFLSSMVNGVKALMYSADFYPEEETDGALQI